jgi:hypothetical protein
MHIQMLRDIDGNTLGKLFTRGMEDNSTRGEFAKAIPGTLQLSELFVRQEEPEGRRATSRWSHVPGTGTQILVNGEAMGADRRAGVLHRHVAHLARPEAGRRQLKAQLLGQRIETPPGQSN